MPLSYNFPYICIFLAMVSAVLLSVVNNAKVAYRISLAVALICTVLSALFLYRIVLDDTAFAFTMGKFPAPFGNEIKGGPLQALLATVFSGVMAMALLGGRTDLFHDVDNKRMGLACVMLNMVLASLLVMVYTNDAFTAYVFIEISTISACALVMIKDSGETLVATVRYLFMSLLGSALFLFAVVIVYAVTGHLLMPQLSEAIKALSDSGSYQLLLTLSIAMMTAGLGIKSAMFPFHRWLPDAHGSASTTSSAVLSGLVLKGYAVLMVLMLVRVFTLEVIAASGVTDIIFVMGFLGMIIGSLYAMRETHAKRMLAYSSVAQLGYVFMGIGLGTEAGIAAACFQMLSHACSKPLLFISVGRLSATVSHNKQWSALRGSAWHDPLAGLGFSLGALSMVGIPLFAGFSSKLNFAFASVSGDVKLVPTLLVLALSSVLNALYYIPALIAIWSGSHKAERSELDRAQTLAACVLMLATVALGVCFSPIMDIIVRGLALL